MPSNHLVVFSSRKRTNQRYGAGRKREKGRPKPSRPTTPSKTPGRRNRLEASGATSPPRTAPYRRFGRFQTKKATTCRRKTQKGTSEPRLAANRPSAHAKPRHADPQRRPPAKWMNWNKPPSPNREKATRGASASKGRAEPRRFG